jgi:hypothetical protein
VQAGIVRVRDDTFASAGLSNHQRDCRISQSLVDWLRVQSLKLRFVVDVEADIHPDGTVLVRFHENTLQST